MATIHLMVGFMGFGKTTLAKKLAETIPAVRLTHDEFMVKLYGRNMPYTEFHPNYDKVDEVLWNLAEKIVKTDTELLWTMVFGLIKTVQMLGEELKK